MKMKRMFAGYAGTLAKPIILSGILARVVVASSLCIKIVFFSGLITATLANARLSFLFVIVLVLNAHGIFSINKHVYLVEFNVLYLIFDTFYESPEF